MTDFVDLESDTNSEILLCVHHETLREITEDLP